MVESLEANDVPYISDEEQAEIEAELGKPSDYEAEVWVDMTHWVKYTTWQTSQFCNERIGVTAIKLGSQSLILP